jgi:hypothetical protein
MNFIELTNSETSRKIAIKKDGVYTVEFPRDAIDGSIVTLTDHRVLRVKESPKTVLAMLREVSE